MQEGISCTKSRICEELLVIGPHRCLMEPWGAIGSHVKELTQPRRGGGGGGGGGLGLCRAAVPPHRVCRVTRGRRCVVLHEFVLCFVEACLCFIVLVHLSCVTYVPCATMTWRGGGGGRWHGMPCNGSCRRGFGTCVTCVTCAGRATMTRRGGGGGGGGGASESVPRHVS